MDINYPYSETLLLERAPFIVAKIELSANDWIILEHHIYVNRFNEDCILES